MRSKAKHIKKLGVNTKAGKKRKQIQSKKYPSKSVKEFHTGRKA